MRPIAKYRLFIGSYAVVLLLVSMVFSDCSGKKQPMLPDAVYSMSSDTLPFRFEVSDQAVFSVQRNKAEEYFCNINYPNLNACIYCTWHGMQSGDLETMARESRALAYSHVQMATGIDEQFYADDVKHVYGILYDIKGPVATPLQLALTDSANYFFNASLYFNATPDADSLAPYVAHIRKDVEQMMRTFTFCR